MDIKITNGRVVDGTGAPERVADIGISGSVIRDVGDLSGVSASTVIEASGKLVCPGFIDAHSHSDAYLLIEPSATSKTFQGITTEVVGNCGASAAPLRGTYQLPSDWQTHTYPGTWSSVAEYRALLEAAEPAPNVVLLIGHKALRVACAGLAHRAVTDEELAQMKTLLEQGMDEGARGLSTGLIYAPAMYADAHELEALGHVVAARDGIYTSHMRSEGNDILEAIQETLNMGRKTGVRVEISHLKISGASNWDKVDAALFLIRDAREEGIDVAADRYPYTSGCTELDVIFPDWAEEGGRAALVARVRNPTERARIRDHFADRECAYWEGITLGTAWDPAYAEYQGMPLVAVAEKLGMEPVDATLHLVDVGEARTTAFFGGMTEGNMMTILAEPYVMIGSDASLRAPEGPLGRDYPHPRAYGAFPKFLRLSLDGKTVPLPEAIRKMTGLPAAHFGLSDRGILAPGKAADVIVIDPETVTDRATYASPHQLAQGLEHAMINGVSTVENGRLTGRRGGRVV